MKYTWKKTDNTVHGQQIEVFSGSKSIGFLWVGQEATDDEIDARLVERADELQKMQSKSEEGP